MYFYLRQDCRWNLWKKKNRLEMRCFGNVSVSCWSSLLLYLLVFTSPIPLSFSYSLRVCDHYSWKWLVYSTSVSGLWDIWVLYQDKWSEQLFMWWHLRNYSVQIWFPFKGSPFLFSHFYFALQNVSSSPVVCILRSLSLPEERGRSHLLKDCSLVAYLIKCFFWKCHI